MHELSMAQGILDSVIENAEKNNATQVTKVVIEIGRLAMLNPEQVKFMLGVLNEDTIASNAEFVIEEIPAEIKCKDCDFEGEAIIDDRDHYMPAIKCPKCDSYMIEVINGKDVIVKNIIIDKEDEN